MKYSTGSINNSSSDVSRNSNIINNNSTVNNSDVLRKIYNNNMMDGSVVYDLEKFKKVLFNENVNEIEDLEKRACVKSCCMICISNKLKEIKNKIFDDVKKNPEKYMHFRKAPQNVRMKLIRTLGLIREQKIEKLLRNSFPEYEGYTVRHWNKEDEPDFIVYKDNVPFMVVEVKNYNEKSFMLESTYQNIIKCLTKYNCFKLLILSSGYNLIRKTIQKHNNKHYTYYNTNLRNTSEELRSRGIYTWILGYQDLMTMNDFNDIVEFAKKKKNSLEKLKMGWIE